MKKYIVILISLVAIFTVTAFNFQDKRFEDSNAEIIINEPTVLKNDLVSLIKVTSPDELVYTIDSRFIHNISLRDLRNAKSIRDIVPKEATEDLHLFNQNKVALLGEAEEITEFGHGELFKTKQLELLKAADYSTNLYVSAYCKQSSQYNGKLDHYDLVYYMTVIPEKEANYIGGLNELIQQIKKETKEDVAVIRKDKLRPGRINFTVTKEGKIDHMKIESSSGYPTIDKKIVTLLDKYKANWNPAQNEKGENIDQELVFFFGLQGC